MTIRHNAKQGYAILYPHDRQAEIEDFSESVGSFPLDMEEILQ